MFYNLAQYLKTQFPSEVIYTNERYLITGQTEIPDRNILVKEAGGIEQAWTQYSEPEIQVICRDSSVVKARKLAYDVFEEITSRFGLILPSITVDSVIYPSIQTAQIKAQQTPYHIGKDEEGRSEFGNNYQIIYGRL